MRLDPSLEASSSSSFDGRCSAEAQEVLGGTGMELTQQRQDLFANEPRFVSGFDVSVPVGESLGAAIGLRLFAPDLEQGADDTVLALGLDPSGHAAGRQPVEDGLDLVGGGMPRSPEPIGRERVADLAQRVLGRGPPGRPSTTSAPSPSRQNAHPPRTLARAGHARRGARSPGTQRAQNVPETGRVRAAGDQAGDLAARWDELVPPDELLDPLPHRRTLR